MAFEYRLSSGEAINHVHVNCASTSFPPGLGLRAHRHISASGSVSKVHLPPAREGTAVNGVSYYRRPLTLATTKVAPRAARASESRPGRAAGLQWTPRARLNRGSRGTVGGLGEEPGASHRHSSQHPSPRPALRWRAEGRRQLDGESAAPSRVQLRGARQPRPCASCWQQTGSFTRRR